MGIRSIVPTVASTIAVLILLAVFFKLAGPLPLTISQTTTSKASSFTASGEGSVSVVPDQAIADFGILTQEKTTVREAQQEANSVMNKLKSALQNIGVKEEDMKTASYNIYPNYSWPLSGEGKINGYSVNIHLQVKFKDFKMLDSAFDEAVKAGANLSSNLQFGLSDELKVKSEAEARTKAITQAKSKAQEIAKEAGINLGKILNVQEEPSYRPPYYSALSTTDSGKATDISPGTSEVKINVILSFETN